MNVFFRLQRRLDDTPPLGTILPGITARRCHVAKDKGTPREEAYSFDQWRADAKSASCARFSPAAPPRC